MNYRKNFCHCNDVTNDVRKQIIYDESNDVHAIGICIHNGKPAVKACITPGGSIKGLPTRIKGYPVIYHIENEFRPQPLILGRNIKNKPVYSFRYPKRHINAYASRYNTQNTISNIIQNTDRVRPICPGLEIGIRGEKSAGTMGYIVNYRGSPAILTNNHVIAKNIKRNNGVPIGTEITQPAGPLANRDDNVIGRLLAYKHIEDKSNKVDIALSSVNTNFVNRAFCGYQITGPAKEAVIGMEVKKCGRTTKYTEGRITTLALDIYVTYDNDTTAYFEDQIGITNMSNSGDSGSLIVDKRDNRPVGLLFAGNGKTTLANHMVDVEKYINKM